MIVSSEGLQAYLLLLGHAGLAMLLLSAVAAEVGGGGDISVLPSTATHLEVAVDLVVRDVEDVVVGEGRAHLLAHSEPGVRHVPEVPAEAKLVHLGDAAVLALVDGVAVVNGGLGSLVHHHLHPVVGDEGGAATPALALAAEDEAGRERLLVGLPLKWSVFSRVVFARRCSEHKKKNERTEGRPVSCGEVS